MACHNSILATGICGTGHSFGLIGLAIGNETAFYVLLGTGSLTGIIVAEYIRRKIGLDTFFARIYGPNEMDKKAGKKN